MGVGHSCGTPGNSSTIQLQPPFAAGSTFRTRDRKVAITAAVTKIGALSNPAQNFIPNLFCSTNILDHVCLHRDFIHLST
ncbi:protein of unknown function [Burkholderia multivorans]